MHIMHILHMIMHIIMHIFMHIIMPIVIMPTVNMHDDRKNKKIIENEENQRMRRKENAEEHKNMQKIQKCIIICII